MAKSKVGELRYSITGDSKELDQSLKKSQTTTAKFTRFMKSALGIGGALLAIRSLIRISKDLVQTYAVQEQAENRLAAAIRATGGDVDVLMQQYKAFASEVQAVTTVGDEQTLGLLQQAQSLGVTTDRMEEAARGAIGLSRAFGIDMNTALRGIALAFEGQYTMLNRYIPALRTAGDEAERQAILQEAMANGFEIARSEAETGTGAMAQLQNAIGDLKEQGGKALSEFLEPSIRSLTDFVTRTTEAIAESRRLKKVADELAEGTKIETADEIALLTQKIAEAERAYEGLGAASDEYAQFVGEGTGATEREIAAMKRRLAVLVEAARWEAIGREAKRKGDAEAATAAEAQAKRQQELAEWIRMVTDEYHKTEEGQRDILEAEIAKWEYELSRSKNYRPQIQAILDMLYEERDAINEGTDAWKERVAAMAAETEAALQQYQLEQDAFAAMEEEKRRIAAEAEAERTRLAEEEAAKRQQVEQAAWDFVTGIWGQLDAINSARARRELDQLRRQHDLELEAFEGTEEEKKALAEQFQREEAKLEYEAALRSWKMQLAGALAAAARAVIESMKLGFPWAIPMVAMALAQSGLQLAALRAAKPVPAFASGADFVVPPGYPNDSFPMMVESGERVQVTPPGEARPIMQAPLVIKVDSGPIWKGLLVATRNGIALVHERGIVGG